MPQSNHVIVQNTTCLYCLFSTLAEDICPSIFLENGRARERRNIDVRETSHGLVASRKRPGQGPDWGGTCSWGPCPWPELSPMPFGPQANALSTEVKPARAELFLIKTLKKSSTLIHYCCHPSLYKTYTRGSGSKITKPSKKIHLWDILETLVLDRQTEPKACSIHSFPVLRTASGEGTGSGWKAAAFEARSP